MYAIVCGGRDYENVVVASIVLDSFVEKYNITTIVQGGAKGADSIAQIYADIRNIHNIEELPEWDKHKNAAGPIRNKYMLDNYPIEIVIGFEGGTGTAHMLNYAKSKKVPCYHVINDTIIDYLTKKIIAKLSLTFLENNNVKC